jgi:hypothetical protein
MEDRRDSSEPYRPSVVARWCVWHLLRTWSQSFTWKELIEGQGRGEVVDMGLGGPSTHYAKGDHMTASNPWGRELLDVCDGYYQDHFPTEDDDHWPPDLRRVDGLPGSAEPFPVEVPCLTEPVTWCGIDEPVVVNQVFLIVWDLRRNYFREADYRNGAEAAERDGYLDITTMGLRLAVKPVGDSVPESLVPWLVERLAEMGLPDAPGHEAC